MEFLSYSAAGDFALDKFLQLSSQTQSRELVLLRKRIESCHFRVSLIASDELPDERIGSTAAEKRLIHELSQAWKSIQNDPEGGPSQQEGWKKIDQIASYVQPGTGINGFPLLRRFREMGSRDHFFILLTGTEKYGLPTYELSFLCSLSQVEGGSLPVHASGVIHQGALYLFAGVSGAGKSTVAKLSELNADQILDDDQVLIQRLEDGSFSARAWGYGTLTVHAPLKGVFFLTQDRGERLVLLSKASAARLLFARCLDIMGNTVMSGCSQKTFGLAAEIARTVPGYELHFRKSPDFWKMIDHVTSHD